MHFQYDRIFGIAVGSACIVSLTRDEALLTNDVTPRWSFPCGQTQSGVEVISATQSRSRASAAKFLSTRSGAGRAFGSRTVVRAHRRRLAPSKPASRTGEPLACG